MGPGGRALFASGRNRNRLNVISWLPLGKLFKEVLDGRFL